MKTLVLDAMGVIYQARDDVVELLCPFIHQHDGIADDREIEALYIEASLGHLSARQFWQEVQVDPNLEDDYFAAIACRLGCMSFCATRNRTLIPSGASRTTFPSGRENCENSLIFKRTSTASSLAATSA